MSTINDILNNLNENLKTTNDVFWIDADTREITTPTKEKIFGVYGDQYSERKYFACKRKPSEDFDFADANIMIMFKVVADDETERSDAYLVTEKVYDDNYVVFSWLLSDNVFPYKGKVLFFINASIDGNPSKIWQSRIASGTILETFTIQLTEDEDNQIRDYVKEIMAEIEAKGEMVKESIPKDYTDLQEEVTNTKDALEQLASGEEGTITSRLSESIMEICDFSVNEFDKDSDLNQDGYSLSFTEPIDGQTTKNQNMFISHPIEAVNGDVIRINMDFVQIYGFKSDGSYTRSYTLSQFPNREITIDRDTISSIRIQFDKTKLSSNWIETLMVTKNTEIPQDYKRFGNRLGNGIFLNDTQKTQIEKIVSSANKDITEKVDSIPNEIFDSLIVVNNMFVLGEQATGSYKPTFANDEYTLALSNVAYPNYVWQKNVEIGHKYLFALSVKETSNTQQALSLVSRNMYAPTVVVESNRIIATGDNVNSYKRGYILSVAGDTSMRFDISIDASKSGNISSFKVKDMVLADVTGLSDTDIEKIAEYGYFEIYKDSIFKQSKWEGKKILVLGDSTSAGGEKWQKVLRDELGAEIYTHATGGIEFMTMVDGSEGYVGDFDNNTDNNGVLAPLKISDVHDKDMIIIFGGFNERKNPCGNVGDVYVSEQSGDTVAGHLQYVINRLYELLNGGSENGITYNKNLKCRIAVVAPYCCGKYRWSNLDGYQKDPNTNESLHDIANIICKVANENNCPSYNAWELSGIGRATWTHYTFNPNVMESVINGSDGAPYPEYADQLHLRASTGYPHLGRCIARWVETIGI